MPFRNKRILEIPLRALKEYHRQHQEAIAFLSSRFLGVLGLLPSTERWALAMDVHVGREVLPWVGRGPFPRGRWLHSHSEIKGNKGHDGDKWQFLRIRCVWLFFFGWNFSMGPSVILGIHFNQNSAAVLKGQRRAGKLVNSLFFPTICYFILEIPASEMDMTPATSFLESEAYFPPETERHGAFSLALKTKSNLLGCEWKKKCSYVLKAMWLAL